MGPGGPNVIHVSYAPPNIEEVYFPQASVVGDVGPSLSLLADRYPRFAARGAVLAVDVHRWSGWAASAATEEG